MSSRPSLRKHINDKCKSCIYDPKAAGTCLQQITLCSVVSCPLHLVRPKSKAPIPESVLDSYFVTGAELRFYRCSRPLEGGFREHDECDECSGKG